MTAVSRGGGGMITVAVLGLINQRAVLQQNMHVGGGGGGVEKNPGDFWHYSCSFTSRMSRRLLQSRK
jgi:hypothetical protein